VPAELPPDFSGAIAAIATAIKSDRITALAATLTGLLAAGAFDAQELYRHPHRDHQARNLIWRDPAGRFVVVGISWAPGHVSPLHDHDGLWGGEIVVSGTMHETRFRMLERHASRYRFGRERPQVNARGSVGMLTPPLEYHAFGNAADSIARTIHVYAGDLTKAHVFSGEGGEWYRAQAVSLTYDG
jgi:predicted metal-dependent enzyme (double-stranded beta helix superfamily)